MLGVLTIYVVLFDILLPIADKVFDVLTILHFINNNDIWWAVATICIILMPGILQLLAWTHNLCTGDTAAKTCIKWSIFFGPITYPISTVLW